MVEQELHSMLNGIRKKDLDKFIKLISFMDVKNSREVVTIRVFTEEYLSFIKTSRSHAYLISVQSSFKHLKNYFSPQKPISTISYKEIEQFVLYMIKTIPRGYRVYYKTLRAAFNKAIEWEYLDQNHFVKVKLPKKQQEKREFITEEQLPTILEIIENKSIKEIVQTSFYTGMRLNEVIHLKWKYVDLTAAEITVGGSDYTTKARNQRVIPICEVLFNTLVELRQSKKIFHLNNDFVFCKPDGNAYCGNYISKVFKKASLAAGLSEGIHFHSLRHSTATILANKNVLLHVIKEIMGHSDISTTMIYSHVTEKAKKEAVKVFGY